MQCVILLSASLLFETAWQQQQQQLLSSKESRPTFSAKHDPAMDVSPTGAEGQRC
jgi:hypothetical protein